MRLSPFLLFLLSTFAFASPLLLNTYDHTGYLLSDEFTSFKFKGECPTGVGTAVEIYSPPDEKVNVYGNFPEDEMIFLSNGISLGSSNTNLVVPKWVLEEASGSEILCCAIPVKFLSPDVIKILQPVKSWELGSKLSRIMKMVKKSWELPDKDKFGPGDVLSLAPKAPTIRFEMGKSDGVGSVIFPEIQDFSKFEYNWVVDGESVDASVLILPPGDHDVTLNATDSLGIGSSLSFEVKITPFQKVVEHLECEIGVDNCYALTGSKIPGIYTLRSVKTYGDFTFVINATETSFPKIQLIIQGLTVHASATDPSGVETFVFVNGKSSDRLVYSKNTVEVVAVDPYGNGTLESTEVVEEPDVRDMLNLRSPFLVGWGR